MAIIRKPPKTVQPQAQRQPSIKPTQPVDDAVASKVSTGDGGGSTSSKQVAGTKGTESVATVASVAAAFDAVTSVTSAASRLVGETVQKTPSKALNQPARIMSPHLLFKDVATSPSPSTPTSMPGPTKDGGDDWFAQLLEKPFVPSASSTSSTSSASMSDVPGPLLAKFPADRSTPVGAIRYGHADGVLVITGDGEAGKKPERLEKKLGFGQAAHYLAAFDAAAAAEYPRFSTSTREPPELWMTLAGADRAASLAVKLQGAQRSPYDAALLLKSFSPKARPIVATKTIMDQIQQMAGFAKAATTGDPQKNLVDLEEKVLNAKGSSLMEEILKNHDRKTGARTLMDDLLEQPVKPAPLPESDSAVVARVGDREVTAGEIRAQAFRNQKAVAFQIEGFADAHGSQRTLTIQVEQRGKNLEWSFHGVVGDRDRIISGDLSPKGIEGFQAAMERQPRYDHIPYKTTVPKFSERLTDAALTGLAKDRAALEAEMEKRGGTPVSDIFPHLNL